MQQMLLILLAIILLALYAFNRQMQYIGAQEVAVEREVETAMMDVKEIWQSYMKSLPYAEEMSDGTLTAVSFSDSDLPSLNRPLGPDAGEDPNDADTFDDFDDFDGYATSNYLFPIRGVEVPFTVEIPSVWYSGTLSASGRSTTKSALIRVTFVNPRVDLAPGEETLTLETIFSQAINED